jgi:hypothetical protein
MHRADRKRKLDDGLISDPERSAGAGSPGGVGARGLRAEGDRSIPDQEAVESFDELADISICEEETLP